MNRIAWMGGSSPEPIATISREERKLVRVMFREQVATFRNYWGDSPNSDTMRIFYGRARHDAHATTRG